MLIHSLNQRKSCPKGSLSLTDRVSYDGRSLIRFFYSRLMPIHRTYDQMPWADSCAIGLLSESRLVEAALQTQCSLAWKHSPWATVKSLVNVTFSPRNWTTISALTKIWEWIRPWYTHIQHLIFVWNGFKPFFKVFTMKVFLQLIKILVSIL